MKLKIKNLNWLTGHPTAILNSTTAKKMNVFVGDRIRISNDKKIYTVIDIFTRLIRKNEIGLSKELSEILKLKDNCIVNIKATGLSGASFLIKKKINGATLTGKELEFLISEIVHNNLPEAEIAFFTAAEKMNGMSFEETVNLTKAMVASGARLKWKGKYIADKHCIGGIAGNRTTPIVISICAAIGIILPKTSSRAITSASGTADVIETISNVELSLKKIKNVVKKTGACLAWGGSLGLAPSDDKIIQIERLLSLDIEPQLLASIMSKKISAGAKYILIDIPYGKGAKVANLKLAKNLGQKFKKMGDNFKLKLKVIYSDGTQPIGNGFGPVLEMLDVLGVLQNNGPQDLKEKSINLAVNIIKLCGIKNARKKAEYTLSSGKAYQKFKEIINAQNGKNNFDKKVANLKLAKFKKSIKIKQSGNLVFISNKVINSLCRVLGTPETISAGVYLHKHTGQVKKNETFLTLYAESKTKIDDALKFLKEFSPVKII